MTLDDVNTSIVDTDFRTDFYDFLRHVTRNFKVGRQSFGTFLGEVHSPVSNYLPYLKFKRWVWGSQSFGTFLWEVHSLDPNYVVRTIPQIRAVGLGSQSFGTYLWEVHSPDPNHLPYLKFERWVWESQSFGTFLYEGTQPRPQLPTIPKIRAVGLGKYEVRSFPDL